MSAPSCRPVLKSTIQRTPSATNVRSTTTCAIAPASTPPSAHSLRASSCSGANSQRARGSASTFASTATTSSRGAVELVRIRPLRRRALRGSAAPTGRHALRSTRPGRRARSARASGARRRRPAAPSRAPSRTAAPRAAPAAPATGTPGAGGGSFQPSRHAHEGRRGSGRRRGDGNSGLGRRNHRADRVAEARKRRPARWQAPRCLFRSARSRVERRREMQPALSPACSRRRAGARARRAPRRRRACPDTHRRDPRRRRAPARREKRPAPRGCAAAGAPRRGPMSGRASPGRMTVSNSSPFARCSVITCTRAAVGSAGAAYSS